MAKPCRTCNGKGFYLQDMPEKGEDQLRSGQNTRSFKLWCRCRDGKEQEALAEKVRKLQKRAAPSAPVPEDFDLAKKESVARLMDSRPAPKRGLKVSEEMVTIRKTPAEGISEWPAEKLKAALDDDAANPERDREPRPASET